MKNGDILLVGGGGLLLILFLKSQSSGSYVAPGQAANTNPLGPLSQLLAGLGGGKSSSGISFGSGSSIGNAISNMFGGGSTSVAAFSTDANGNLVANSSSLNGYANSLNLLNSFGSSTLTSNDPSLNNTYIPLQSTPTLDSSTYAPAYDPNSYSASVFSDPSLNTGMDTSSYSGG